MKPTYRVELTKSAKKEFDRLPARVQRRVTDAVALLAINPFSELLQIRKLRGTQAVYRLRLGDHRIIYELRKRKLIIVVIKIGDHKEVYRRR